jgi:hypothetical protein
VKAPTPSDPPVETPPAAPTPPPAPAEPRVAAWPQWVKSVDVAMATLVLVAAFMVASNVARNSDQWLNYATGRALLQGTYSFGTDPFSFATEGRVWVNHNWLAAAGMYLLYNADPTGFVIVVVKAFLFAAAFGVLLLIRRSGRALWPWVGAAAIAMIAAAPQSSLRPFLLNGPFLALTLAILLGRDWKSGARANLIGVGILFWLWASCDAWFVLGPLAVGVVLLGEALQGYIRKSESDDHLPSIGQLAAALAIGALACSATPHHVRVWQLPIELGLSLPPNYQSDYETAMISLSPLNERLYLRLTGRGWNGNGVAFAALLFGGGLALAVGYARLRVAHLLLWIAFAGLALVHIWLILTFAVVAVPVLATAIGGLVDRIQLGSPDGPRAKLLLMLSSVGRLIAFPFALMLVAAAYPGWLHPPVNHPSMARRCAWGVEPDAGLKRSAELLQRWRDAGALPDDYRGIVINFDLANHIAWFAPKEKVLVNSRHGLHLPELEEFIKARRIFLDRQPSETIEDIEIANFREFCHKHDVTYVVYSGITLPPALRVDTTPLYQLSSFNGTHSLWHVDGRCVILGDRSAKRYDLDRFRALSFNPIRLAFHPDFAQPALAPPEGTRKTTTEPTFLDPFLNDPPKPPPLEALDATIWNEIAIKHAEMDFFQKSIAWPMVAGGVGNFALAQHAQQVVYRADDLTTAYRFLALRAAYRAIAENPDHPEAYLVLAYAGGFGRGPEDQGVPAGIPGLRDDIKRQLEVAGLRQYLDRINTPETIRPSAATPAYYASIWLYNLYASGGGERRPPVAESMSQVFSLVRRYFPRTEMAARDSKRTDQIMKAFEQQANQLDALTARANDRLMQFKDRDLHQQIRAAIELRLYGQAHAKFQDAWPDALGPDTLGLTLQMVRVYLELGVVDEADYYLREVDGTLEKLAENPKTRPQAEAYSRYATGLRSEIRQLRGDFARTGSAMEESMKQLSMNDLERGFARVAASKPTLRDFDAFINTPHLMATVGGVGTLGQGAIQFSTEKWQSHIDFFIHRGLVLLLEGKPSEARYRFEQALRPEKIDLPSYLPQRTIAEQYIRMIDAAAK